MSKEVIELLEEIKTAAGKGQRDVFYFLKADQALAILKQSECKTCGDTKKINCDECGGSCDFKVVGGNYSTMCKKCDLHGKIPCPDCQKLPASEFTKEIREYFADFIYAENNNVPMQHKPRCLEHDLMEACDRLDKAEAENQNLKEKLNAESYRFREQKQINKELKAQVAEYMRMKE